MKRKTKRLTTFKKPVDAKHLQLEKLVNKINDENNVDIPVSSKTIQNTFRKIVDIVDKYLPFLSLSFFIPSFFTLKNKIQTPKTTPVLAMYIAVAIFAVAYFFVLMDFRNCKTGEGVKDKDGTSVKDFQNCDAYKEYSDDSFLKNNIVGSIYYIVPLSTSSSITSFIVDTIHIKSPLLKLFLNLKIKDLCFKLFEFKVSPGKSNTLYEILLRAIEAVQKEMFNYKKYSLL